MTRLPLLTSAIAVALLLAAPAAPARAERVDCEPVHSTIDAELTAACPCDGFESHGRYVRCITRKLRAMAACETGADSTRTCGPVPRSCVGKIRRIAELTGVGEARVASALTSVRPMDAQQFTRVVRDLQTLISKHD